MIGSQLYGQWKFPHTYTKCEHENMLKVIYGTGLMMKIGSFRNHKIGYYADLNAYGKQEHTT